MAPDPCEGDLGERTTLACTPGVLMGRSVRSPRGEDENIYVSVHGLVL